MVVLYHCARHLDHVYTTPDLMRVFQFGHAGVDFFFVISGFIILLVHYRDIGQPARLGHYVLRRFTRVWPTYWVALALTIALATAGEHAFPTLRELVLSISLLPSDTEPLLGIAWTLQFESAFYAVFAVLILNRIAGLALLAAWLCWIVATQFGLATPALPKSLPDIANLLFFLGMAMAYWLRNHHVPAPRLILALGLALFAASALAEDFGVLDGYARIARLTYGVPAGLIVLGAAAADRERNLAVPAALRVLGTASYSIYLFQFIFIGVLWKLWLASGLDRQLPHVASWPLLAAGGVIGGIVASRLVEYPLMRLLRRPSPPATVLAQPGSSQ